MKDLLEQKIVQLEEQITFTDHLVQELNKAVTNLYQEQIKLTQQIHNLNNKNQQLQLYLKEIDAQNLIRKEIPPHY